MSEPLRDLGRFIAQKQDRALEQRGAVAEVVRRTIAARSKKRSARRAMVTLVPLAAALAVLLYFVLRPPATPDAPLATSQPTMLVAGAEDQAHAFPDGTTVLLTAGGAAQVTDVNADGGRIVLNNGHMRISVPPNRGRRWAFAAGSYLVEVKGTRFDLGWDEATRRFDLEMFDGSVLVTGPDIEPRLVVAGQRLTLGGEQHATATATAAPIVAAPEAKAEPAKSASAMPSGAASSGGPAHSAQPERPGWQPLALEGRYADAVKQAEDAGFDGVVAKSSASELLLLGDACRFAGKTVLASRAYETVRNKHAGTLEAKRAIFSLGVLAFPGKAAIPLFEQYLSEAPGGPLAPEALGRILEVRFRNGEREAARTLAAQYLAQNPKGAHARLAQSILDDATR